MEKFIIRPQEIYLLERYSSADYFKGLVEAFKNMLDAAETALQLFMTDLPYNYRDKHISEQPDVVWGETVLPNFRATMDALNYGYQRLIDGDLSALQYAGNVLTDFRAQRIDYWPDWMDEENLNLFELWQSQASKLAVNIKTTVFSSWPVTFLTENYDSDYLGVLNLPETLPVYRYNSHIMMKTGETVPQDGIYQPAIDDAGAQMMLKAHDVSEALVGLDPDCPQYDHLEPSEWILIERIADEGGNSTQITVENLKVAAGQICLKTGNWWSPANHSKSRCFEKGEVMPSVENTDWGETIWYLEITNEASEI